MTITYNLDVAHFGFKGFLSILFRWRGSVWKAVALPLLYWLIAYYSFFCCYYFLFRPYDKYIFDKVMDKLRGNLNTFIPMTFILGFFVSSVLRRWQDWLTNMGWIENTATVIATYINGTDEITRAMRRNIIRYLVLSQTLVLRNISVEVRRRFPTLETVEAANFMSSEERKLLEKSTDDVYTQFWIPTIWAEKIVCDARKNEKIQSEPIAAHIARKIDDFRKQLRNLLIYDWVPIPLVYPQLVTFCVRLYFVLCLFTRQFFKSDDIGLPVSTSS
uniref:Bestrophin homolog n=1 Tax=Panagrolaimus superbus TaxID=310955 RepID=A0A914YGI4_9BILA